MSLTLAARENTYDPGTTNQNQLSRLKIGGLCSNKEELSGVHSGASVGSRAVGEV